MCKDYIDVLEVFILEIREFFVGLVSYVDILFKKDNIDVLEMFIFEIRESVGGVVS